MAVSIEDILLARAAADEANRPTTEQAVVAGALLGSAGGVGIGQAAHSTGELMGSAKRFVTRAGDKPIMSRVRPGYRMAGGLVGAILGGGLGAGTREVMLSESPAARILARAQAQGELTVSDEKMLEDILADTYSNTLGM